MTFYHLRSILTRNVFNLVFLAKIILSFPINELFTLLISNLLLPELKGSLALI